ncbi:MAG TPA: hypothetical protein VNQ79_14060 [Blastocatellia bacterium]|nr:hypothetical protein [Blastocatellia bacterium]
MTELELTDSYHDFLLERLRDPAQAEAYLNAALEDENAETFHLALQDVAQAHNLQPDVSLSDNLADDKARWSKVALIFRSLNLRIAARYPDAA